METGGCHEHHCPEKRINDLVLTNVKRRTALPTQRSDSKKKARSLRDNPTLGNTGKIKELPVTAS